MPGMPEIMSLLPGSAAVGYELIYAPIGGTCLCCFVDVSAENRTEAFGDADILQAWNDVFKELLPTVMIIFPPALTPYLFYSYAVDLFISITRDIAWHMPRILPIQGDYPGTWTWEHFYPILPNALIDQQPI